MRAHSPHVWPGLLLATAALAAEPLIPGLAVDHYPRVQSSTSTHLLNELLLARFLGLPATVARLAPNWHDEVRETAAVVFPLGLQPRALGAYVALGPEHAFSPGTHEAYDNLLRGNCDLALVAREPSKDELNAAAEAKVEFDVRPVALDALVFVVHRDNPVKNLTLNQVRAIYTGQALLWQPLGGPDLPIKAITREANSGSLELMDSLVMHGRPMVAGAERIVRTMIGTIEVVAKDPTAIAYTVYYYDRVMLGDYGDRVVPLEGVTPSAQTIADRSYPLVAAVQLVTRRGLAPTSPTARLRDWLLSPDGQQLVADSGYVPLKP